jgi:hypothetical protein
VYFNYRTLSFSTFPVGDINFLCPDIICDPFQLI